MINIPRSDGTRPSLIVEFAGAPGSGKSTLCGKVAESLRERGEFPVHVPRMEKIVDLRSLRDRRGLSRWSTASRMTAHTLRCVTLHPGVFYRFLKVLRTDKRFTLSDLLLQVQIHSSRLSKIRRLRDRPGVHLCDSGAVTSHCQMKMYGAKEGVPPIDPGGAGYVVVCLNVPEEELRERIMGRPHNPRARQVHSRDPGRLRRFLLAFEDVEAERGPSGRLSFLHDVKNIENHGPGTNGNTQFVAGLIEREWERITTEHAQV